ncbi:MAG: hypothetical protein C0523_02555 [Cytophaga sp.]|nr:hypothetical protein [Cytophaga sp.]
MSVFNRFYLVVAFVGLACLSVNGQAAYTPFSSFGIGDYYGNSLVHNQGMGGVGISNPQTWYLNNQNPALLVFNTLTSFSAGYLVDSRTIRNSSANEKNTNGNINYLVLGLPIKRGKWTTSIGMNPYTNVNYKLTYTQEIENSVNTVDVTETGAGGINQLSWSHGVAITRNISVGLKANYYFSSIDRHFVNQLSQSASTLIIPSIHTRQHFSDFNLTGGLSIRKDSLFKKNYRFNFGVVYDFKTNIKTKYYEAVERNGTTIDTLANNEIRQTTLPQTIAAGISFGRPEYWTLGTDFTFLDYSQFRDINGSNSGTTQGWKWAVGAEVTPDPLSVSSYLKRMTYRTGVSLEKYPYLINGNTLQDMSVNFGFSMPVSRVSNLDFAVKYGQRGDIKTNTVSEKYFKVSLGITFNDQWFIKRRFD